MKKSEAGGTKPRGLPPKDWEKFFREANVRAEALAECKSERSKAVKMGQFLSPHVGREVPIQVKGRSGRAVLRAEEGRSKEKRYYFEVIWDVPSVKPASSPRVDKDDEGPSPRKVDGKKPAQKTRAKGAKATKGGTESDGGEAAKGAAGPKRTKTAKKTVKKTVNGGKKAAGKPPEEEKGRGKSADRGGGGNELDW